MEKSSSARALNAVHSAFFLSDQALSLGVLLKTKKEVPRGHVEGGELLRQIRKQLDVLNTRFKVDIRVRAIGTASKMLLHSHGIDLETWEETMEKEGVTFDMEKFTSHVRAEWVPHWVIVDLMKDEKYVYEYPRWIKQHIHVVSSNKAALSAPLDSFLDIIAATRKSFSTFKFESCVCAGLPVVSMLRDILDTGDSVTKITGVFSGTLSLIFNSMRLDPTLKFSEAVQLAIDADCAEPDPREDLSGMDVARKIVAMARFIGFTLDLKAVQVEPLISSSEGTTWKEAALEADERIALAGAKAAKESKVLSFVASIVITEHGTCEAKVGLEALPSNSLLGQLTATDACAIIHTNRMASQPIIVQGPAAALNVTAKAVFADILRLSRELGARDGGVQVIPESPFLKRDEGEPRSPEAPFRL